jgi:Cysteine rich repeat
MGRICGAVAMLALLSGSPAFGQYVAVIQTCNRDIVMFCAPDRQERNRLIQCTEAHFQDFTAQCQAALVKIGAVREACRVDIREQCPGVKPGAGRILLCVKEHFADLTEACKDAIGHAAERKVGAR